MSIVPRMPLAHPLEKRSTPVAGEPGLDRAWQREMEKAQTQRWFHGASRQGTGHTAAPRNAPSSAPFEEVRASTSATVFEAAREADAPLPQQPRAAAAPAGIAAPFPVVSPRVAAGASAPAAPSPGWRSIALPARSLPVTAKATAPQSNVLPSETPSPADETIRVHVETTADGLHVWFGLAGDSAAVAARAQSLLAELRRACAGTGERLARVVCNGETVFDGGTEAPLPSHSPPQEP